MAARREQRWRTRFGGWVARVTVAGIVAELSQRGMGITNKGVYDWLSGRTLPAPQRAMTLVQMSRGRLKLEDVFRHRQEVRGDGNGAGRRRGFSGEGAVAARAANGDRRN